IPHPDNLGGPRPGQVVKSYYAVTQGQEVGIYFNWPDAAERIHGVSDAKHQKYNHWVDAVEAYCATYNAGAVRVTHVRGSCF
ncbi:hypothetical protein BJ138DRAFT_994715, partial [Hygrophoropsis aurantiaca]